jgi:hypothetical protein
MPLTIGVLIIGSLYWRNGKRKRWRDWRLDADRKWLVKTPIRYGRLSQNKTYTMVFFPDSSGDQFGQAIVVPCRRGVLSSEDLIKEAEWLWSAEDNEVPSLCCSSPKQSISASWGGCVALMGNPESEIPHNLLREWAMHVAKHYQAEARRLVDGQGILQVPWPKLSLDNSLAPIDLLLATSNDRELNYPTVQQIADAWRLHPKVDYFRKNRENEIETFEDQEILARMQVQQPTASPPDAGTS